jgi:hypothetical protein
MLFSAQEYKPKSHSGLLMHEGNGMKWAANRILWVPRRDAGVGVVQAIVEGHVGRVDRLLKDLLVGRRG